MSRLWFVAVALLLVILVVLLGATRTVRASKLGMSRWWLLADALLLLTLLVLLAPLWSGYFGPAAVTYVDSWRPWRSDVAVRLERSDHADPQQAWLVATYSDPWWPGENETPGDQTVFVTATRSHPLLPWTVSARGSGP
jgi:hypothetical protein